MKKIIVISSLLLLWLPFIFLQDFFPFFRFGMFAEPVRYEIQYDQFVVMFYKKGEQKQIFDPETIQLNTSRWDLLWRNAYYQGKATEKLELFAKSRNEKGITWELRKIIHKKGEKDTVLCGVKIHF